MNLIVLPVLQARVFKSNMGATGAASFVASADSKIADSYQSDDISTGIIRVFVGLSEVDTTIIDSGANSSANHIGFELVDDNLEIDFHSESGEVIVQVLM